MTTGNETARLNGDRGFVIQGRRSVAPGSRIVPMGRSRQRARVGPGRDWNRLLTWSLSLMILVFVGRVQEAVPGIPDLQLGNVAVLLGLLGLAQLGYIRTAGRILKTPQGKLGLGFIGLAMLSVPFALWPGGAMQALLAFLRTSVLFVMIVVAVRQPKQLMLLTTVFAIGAALLANAYVVDLFLGGGALTEQEFVAFDRNDVALLSVMAIPFALALTVKGGARAWAGFALAGYLALGVVATDSRGGFLALAVTSAFIFFKSRILSSGKKAVLVTVGVVAMLVGGSAEYWDRIEAIFTAPSADYNFTSRDGRIEIWKRGIGYFAAHPLTGVGIGNFPVAEGESLKDEGFGVKWSTAHSAYILAAAELGVGGLLIFLAILWSVAAQAKRSRRSIQRGRGPPDTDLRALAEATGYSTIGYSVAAVFLSVTYGVSFVFLVAVGASLNLLTRSPPVANPGRAGRSPGLSGTHAIPAR